MLDLSSLVCIQVGATKMEHWDIGRQAQNFEQAVRMDCSIEFAVIKKGVLEMKQINWEN